MHHNSHRSIAYNSQDIKAIGLSTDKWIKKMCYI